MATRERKTTVKKRKKPAIYVEDRDLRDALNTRKRSYTFKTDSIIPVMEPLIIDRNFNKVTKKPKPSDKGYSLEIMSERTKDYTAKKQKTPEMTKEQKQQVRKLTARKLFETFIAIGIVLFSGLFLIMLLFPQTELSELSRDNSNLKDSINTVRRKILDAEDNANGITDMDAIRAQALQLGMQDPNQNQVINLPIPNNDSLKTVLPYDTYGVNDDVLRVNQDALEEYYAAHPGR